MGKYLVLNKYLGIYSEEEVLFLTEFPDRTYDQALLIPVYLEAPDFLIRLKKTLANSGDIKILLVVVSNHPIDLPLSLKEQALSCHQKIIEHLTTTPIWNNGNLSLFEHVCFDVLLVERLGSNGLPAHQGVGLARKIGADLIASLFHSKKLRSNTIRSTDADATIPSNYFDFDLSEGSSSAVYDYAHLCDESQTGKATKLYERSIRHYVEGLEFAGSSYAFSTLGSCLAIDVEAYAHARGFPKKSAAEDFYLLNKIAKLGTVERFQTTIEIKSRISARAPFGTGPAVAKLIQCQDMHDEPIFYNPLVFDCLKVILRQFSLRPQSLSDMDISKESINALRQTGIEKAFEHSQKQALTGSQYDLHIKSWFDGFKTLKFIHSLRDSYYPSTSCRDLYPELIT